MSDSNIKKAPKPLVLVILDGWGIYPPYSGNAITQANTPFIDNLITQYPSMTLHASGESVGLPWGEPGNSEVGHLSLGLGRILYQDLPRINKNIGDNSFYRNQALLKAVEHVKKNNSKLHIMGVISNGCVHASIDHMYALMILARQNHLKNIYIHAILDGRDTVYNSGVNFIKGIQNSIKENGIGTIATISGRFYAMDRNNNWSRTAKAYQAMALGIGNREEDPVNAVNKSYKKKIYDEEFVPAVITENGEPAAKIENNDALIFFNYRPDRARQITKAFVLPEFDRFDRKQFLDKLFFVGFTEYEKGLPMAVAFPPEKIVNCLGEILAKHRLKQLRIAETEKYAHVTYFFNGGTEKKYIGEDHELVPSPSVSSYDQKPEMSAEEITRRVINRVKENIYNFILINYANPDMVGHTGNLPAAVKGLEFLDACVARLTKSILNQNGVVIYTADHGNAEIMLNMQTGQIDKEHTTNPVPFIVVGKEYAGRNFGWQDVVSSDLSLIQPQGILSDIAPTILKLLNIKKPKEMNGNSLI